jgi:hypothetical protein
MRPSLHRALALVVATFLILAAVTGFRVGSGWQRLTVAGATALGTGALLTGWAALRRPDAGGLVIGAAAALGWFPFLALGAAWALTRPLVVSHWRCGTGDAGLAMLSPFLTAVPMAAGFGVGTAALRLRLHRVLRTAALAGLVVSGVVLATAVPRARGVEPDRWVETIPIALEVGPDAPGATHGLTFSVKERPRPNATPDMKADCVLVVGPGDSEVRLGRWSDMPGCPRVRVRPVSAELLLIDEKAPDMWRTMAIRRSSGSAWELEDVRPRDVPGLALPREWLLTAAIGLVMAVLLAVRALFAARATAAREAVHRGGGWIDAEGLGLRHVPAAAPLPQGPVLVSDGAAPFASYRADVRPEVRSVEAGSTEELAERRRLETTARLFAAMACAVLCTAPLWGARLGGF